MPPRHDDRDALADSWMNSLRAATEEVFYATLRLTRSEALEFGFSVPQVFILQALQRIGSVPISSFVRWSGNTAATVGGVLDSLERKGIVRRAHGAADRRQVLVSLTPKGVRACAKLEGTRIARWRRLGSRFRRNDAAIAGRVLHEIARGFDSRGRKGVRPSRTRGRALAGRPSNRVRRANPPRERSG